MDSKKLLHPMKKDAVVDCIEGGAEIKLDKNGYSLFFHRPKDVIVKPQKGCLSAMEMLVG